MDLSLRKSKLSWFKHYNTASDGQSMSQLWANGDTETIAFYWAVLEMVSKWEQPDKRGFWEANLSIFKLKLGINRQRSSRLLTKICLTFGLKVSWKSDESFQLFIPNWLELQETRGGKNLAKSRQSLGEERRERREERSKNPPKSPKGGVADELAIEALSKINAAIEKKWRPVDANLKFLKARLADGASLDDLIDVARIKHTQWKHDQVMRTFVRIETLYNATKFESYLSEVLAARERIKLNGELFGQSNGVSSHVG